MVIQIMDGHGADMAAAAMGVKKRSEVERTAGKSRSFTSEGLPGQKVDRWIETWCGKGLETVRVGLERKWAEKSSKNRGKKCVRNDFLIDARRRKVVISNRSGNYNNLPAFH
jgi:hypothetical protein